MTKSLLKGPVFQSTTFPGCSCDAFSVMTRERERKEEGGGGEQRCLRWKEDGKDGGIDGWMDAKAAVF